jgi:hypothetical protein
VSEENLLENMLPPKHVRICDFSVDVQPAPSGGGPPVYAVTFRSKP